MTEDAKKRSLAESLLEVQSALSVPKDRTAAGNRFNFRTAEDIEKKLKPLLVNEGLTLDLSDRLEIDNGYCKIVSTAMLRKGAEVWSRDSVTLLDPHRSGMDQAQATGAAISYARKYVLCGLFLVDDSRDVDAVASVTAVANEEAAKRDFIACRSREDFEAAQRKWMNLVDLNSGLLGGICQDLKLKFPKQ